MTRHWWPGITISLKNGIRLKAIMMKDFIGCGNIIYFVLQELLEQERLSYGRLFFLKMESMEVIKVYANLQQRNKVIKKWLKNTKQIMQDIFNLADIKIDGNKP